MINEYVNISVIWGGEFGKKNSLRIQQILDNLHLKEGYPVRCRVQNSYVPSSNILKDVKDLFYECDYVIMLLSATDEGRYTGDVNTPLKKRLRQNILLELGMAVAIVGEDRMACLTDFCSEESGDIEIPSDLKPLFFINIQDMKTKELRKLLLDILIQKLKLTPCVRLYSATKYTIDYKDLFSHRYNSAWKQGTEGCLALFQYWKNISFSFDSMCERCIYVFERIKFLSIFSRSDDTIRFLNLWKDELFSKPASIRHDEELDLWMKNLLKVCLEYITHRLDMKRRHNAEEYFIFVHQLEACARDFESGIKKNKKYNPLLGVILYEYYGLALLHSHEQTLSVEWLDQVISVFETGYKYAKKVDTTANMWMGFLEFDLARVYEKRLAMENNRENFVEADRMYIRCIETRKQWPKVFALQDFLRNALNYEYIKAELARLLLHKKYRSFSKESTDIQRAKALQLLDHIAELEVTYERINDVKSAIKKYLEDSDGSINEV